MPAPRRVVPRFEPVVAPAPAVVDGTDAPTPLPADDPTIFSLDLDGLAARWSRSMAATPIGA